MAKIDSNDGGQDVIAKQPESQAKKGFLDGLKKTFQQLGSSMNTKGAGENGNQFSERGKQEANRRLDGINPSAGAAIRNNGQTKQDILNQIP